MGSYFVYMHRTPSNKVYIGITCQPRPELRWQSGKGYIGNAHFCNAIRKYGWDNIEHIILYTGLTKEEAYAKEIELIAYYNSTDSRFGYNHTFGGDSNPMDIPENRDKVSKVLKMQRNTPEWKSFISNKLMGHAVSAETREKISKANLGRTFSQECIDKRVKTYRASFTEERRRKLSEASKRQVWSEERRRIASESRKGIPMSSEAKSKLSRTKKRKVAEGYILVWVNNGVEEHSVIPENVQLYLDSGYTRGRLMKKHIFMHRGTDEIMVSSDDVEYYQLQGYTTGPSDSRKEAIRKGVQSYIYVYKGDRFNSAEELAIYLHSHGYPNIVSSTITSMCRKGKSLRYNDILQELTRIKVK